MAIAAGAMIAGCKFWRSITIGGQLMLEKMVQLELARLCFRRCAMLYLQAWRRRLSEELPATSMGISSTSILTFTSPNRLVV